MSERHIPREFCANGHPWTPENTRMQKNGNRKRVRICRICENDAVRRYREKFGQIHITGRLAAECAAAADAVGLTAKEWVCLRLEDALEGRDV